MIQIATFMEFIKSDRNAATSLEYDLIGRGSNVGYTRRRLTDPAPIMPP
jgi:hypothetical protein